MTTRPRPLQILCAEDDPDDRALVKKALGECGLSGGLRFVRDGEELLDYLSLGDTLAAPRPDLILLDLRMPRKDGRAALREIKANPALRAIPVVVVTVSRAEEDVFRSYDLGATSIVRKSAKESEFVDDIRAVGSYWSRVANLPGVPKPRARRVLVPAGVTSGLLFVAVTFADLRAAVAAVRDDPTLDAVTLDLEVDGAFAVLAEIKSVRPELPVVALSSDVFDAGSALRAGAAAFLEKPYEHNQLEDTLMATLRRSS